MAHRTVRTGTAAIMGAAALLSAYSEVAETVEDHVVPRRSLTERLMLGYGELPMEFEPIKGKQLDRKTGKMVEVNDQRLVWKGDRSLLNRSKGITRNQAGHETLGTFKVQRAVSQGNNTRKYLEVQNDEVFRPDSTDTDRIDISDIEF